MSAVTKAFVGAGMITVGAVLLASGVGAGFGVPLIMGGIGLEAGALEQALTPTPRIGAGGARGSDVNIQQTIPPELVVYGEVAIPGTAVFVGRHTFQISNNPDDEYSHWIYVHTASRPMQGIVAMVIDGKYTELQVNGTINDKYPPDALIPSYGKYKKNIGIYTKNGNSDDALFSYLMEKVPTKWTDKHQLNGISATLISYLFDPDIMPNGPPNVRFVWDGFMVNDPRTPGQPPVWTQNAALCIADALYGPHAGAGAIQPSQIDPDTLVAAANACDFQRTRKDGVVVSNYVLNGFADASNDYDTIIKDMLRACNGSLVRVGETYKIFVGEAAAVEVDLFDTDRSGPPKFQILRDLDTKFNEIHSLYPDSRLAWNDSQSPTFPPFGVIGGGGGWQPEGIFSLGAPRTADFWYRHHNATNNATFATLSNGLSLKGGTRGDEDENSEAWASKVHLDGDFTVAFSTMSITNNKPPSTQADLGFRLFFAASGKDDAGHPKYLQMWSPTTKPNRNVYASNVNGAFVRMYRMTPTDTNNTDPIAVSRVNGSGSLFTCAVTGPTTEVDYSPNKRLDWVLTRVGDGLNIALHSDTQDLEWDVDITGVPTRGGFILLSSAGLTVQVTAFRVLDGTVVSYGPLMSSFGSWPSTAITYAFPGSSFTGWRDTSDGVVTTPLADTFVPASSDLQTAFAAVLAQVATDTGFTFTTAAAGSAQILLAESPDLADQGFSAYTFRAPSGAIFVDQAHASDDLDPGSYLYQLLLKEVLVALGVVEPPAGSPLDTYSLTLMVRDSANSAPWWSALRQADKDAVKAQYDQTLDVTEPDASIGIIGPLTTNPFRDEDGGQQLVTEIRQPFCDESEQVQRVQKQILMEHRLQRPAVWSAPFRPDKVWMTHPMMVVTYTDPLVNMDHVKFRVGRYQRVRDGSIQLTFVRYEDASYAWAAEEWQVEDYEEIGGLVLVDDSVATEKNIPIDIDPLANDQSGASLSITTTSNPANGTTTISDDGLTITYTPATDFLGVDTFTYTATDGADEGTATITVDVVRDDIASAVDDFAVINDDNEHLLRVLDNDHPVAAAKTVTHITTPSHGTARILGDASDVAYTRTAGEVGFDSFDYTLTITGGTTSVATISLTLTNNNGRGNEPGQNSNLPWCSGVTGPGDPDSVGGQADAIATWRGRGMDIANFRMDRIQVSESDLIDRMNSKSGYYATAHSNNIRVEQVMPMFTDQFSRGSHPTKHAAAAAGAYDATHTTIANRMQSYSRIGLTVLRLAHECGSGSQADAYSNDPSPGYRDFKAAFRRIASIYKNRVSNIEIEWNNIRKPPDPRPAYPGDDIVDIIGVDAYAQVLVPSDFIATDADWSAYANGVTRNGSPTGPRAWWILSKGYGKKFSVAEWGVSPKPLNADQPRYIRGMFELFQEAAAYGNMAYECYFNAKDGSNDHRIFVSGNPNPNCTTQYHDSWHP